MGAAVAETESRFSTEELPETSDVRGWERGVMRRRRGGEDLEKCRGGYRVFRVVARLGGRIWITRLQAYSCGHALKKFHSTQSQLPFSEMSSVVIIEERDLPR
jgi:hypothetical protein